MALVWGLFGLVGVLKLKATPKKIGVCPIWCKRDSLIIFNDFELMKGLKKMKTWPFQIFFGGVSM